jgi:hypothetical protein
MHTFSMELKKYIFKFLHLEKILLRETYLFSISFFSPQSPRGCEKIFLYNIVYFEISYKIHLLDFKIYGIL